MGSCMAWYTSWSWIYEVIIITIDSWNFIYSINYCYIIFSAFNVLVAIFLFLVVIVEILGNLIYDRINDDIDRGHHEFINTDYYGLSLAGAFVSFSFSYGAHAIVSI